MTDMKENKHMTLTMRDPNQITQHTHDEEHNATRVILAQGIQLDTSNIESALKEAFSNMKMPEYPSSSISAVPSIQVVEVPVIVKEQEIVYVDRIVVETRVVEIEKPIYLETLKIVEIEKQIIVEKQLYVKVPEFITKYEPIPSWMKVSFALFLGLSLVINILSMLLKH